MQQHSQLHCRIPGAPLAGRTMPCSCSRVKRPGCTAFSVQAAASCCFMHFWQYACRHFEQNSPCCRMPSTYILRDWGTAAAGLNEGQCR